MKKIDLAKYKIVKNKLPVHIAIIMDGNGRWAKEKKLPRIEGHREGIESVRDIVESCGEIGIKYLTLYTFSEENWSRPIMEVKEIISLLYEQLDTELDGLNQNNVKVQFIGRIHKLPGKVKKRIERMVTTTQKNTGLCLTFAISYSGRAEIIDAVNKIIDLRIKKVNEKGFKKYLYTHTLPDPDLLIRTSGEQRVSNFLLYQIAYTEIVFTSILWPDFRTNELLQSIYEYQQRERRFGGR
ncbi:MAG: isoprenyl transferase [Candidatus Stahlbacteria bacterium]|nr:isoprenyl transferase [Candidatus Stahlbacteria bacterium]